METEGDLIHVLVAMCIKSICMHMYVYRFICVYKHIVYTCMCIQDAWVCLHIFTCTFIYYTYNVDLFFVIFYACRYTFMFLCMYVYSTCTQVKDICDYLTVSV